MSAGDTRPLIAHVIHRLATGGLENGLVNLVNSPLAERYRHAVVCMTEATDFQRRIRRADVRVLALGKREGQDFAAYRRLWRLFRGLRPAIVHTRTWATLEAQVYAALAGVAGRVHGEHGQGVRGPEGSRWRHRAFRRAIDPLISRYVAVTDDLGEWLDGLVSSPAARVARIYNGVDTQRFFPASSSRAIGPPGFCGEQSFVIGTVGRMVPVKDPLGLPRAWLHLRQRAPRIFERTRLVLVGDGPLRAEAVRLIAAEGCQDRAWAPGERTDIPEVMRGFDLFVLPSLAEGMCNTILEAMASGLPVVATRVGGNPELVRENRTGLLVPSGDPQALAAAIEFYIRHPRERHEHGKAARIEVEKRFSLDGMVRSYIALYDAVRARHRETDLEDLTKTGRYNCPQPLPVVLAKPDER
jgi:sugar transferase (PEP-CTERM/EpsH1 system associated)